MYLVSRMMWVITALSPSLFLPIYLNLPNISHTVSPYTPPPPPSPSVSLPLFFPFFLSLFSKICIHIYIAARYFCDVRSVCSFANSSVLMCALFICRISFSFVQFFGFLCPDARRQWRVSKVKTWEIWCQRSQKRLLSLLTPNLPRLHEAIAGATVNWHAHFFRLNAP